MADATGRFALPFILPGQAQKELFHNEALLALDAALHPAVETNPTAAVPDSPALGQCWIVEAGAVGAWAGKANCLAAWTESGWRFLAPPAGTSVWNKAGGLTLRFDGSAWSQGEAICSMVRISGVKVVGERQPAVPSPSGGTIIDAEARAAVNQLIAALMSHGLID